MEQNEQNEDTLQQANNAAGEIVDENENVEQPRSMGSKVAGFFKCIAQALLFFAILIGLLLGLGYVLGPKDVTVEAGMEDARGMGFLAEPNNTLEAVYLGSSLCSTAISPMQMYQDSGLTSYVCATNGAPVSNCYSMLRRVFQTQKPSVVVLEVDSLYINVDNIDLLKRALKDALPVMEYRERWKEVTISELFSAVNYHTINDLKGFNPKTMVDPCDGSNYMSATTEVQMPSDVNLRVLRQLHQLCEDNNAQLLIVSVPSASNWNMAKHNAVQQICDDMSVPFYDMNLDDSVGIDWNTDTRDAGSHLNYKGAQKATTALCNYLHANYELRDKRQDAGIAAEWDICLQKYLDKMADVAANPQNYDTFGAEVN